MRLYMLCLFSEREIGLLKPNGEQHSMNNARVKRHKVIYMTNEQLKRQNVFVRIDRMD